MTQSPVDDNMYIGKYYMNLQLAVRTFSESQPDAFMLFFSIIEVKYFFVFCAFFVSCSDEMMLLLTKPHICL